jgi:hypothetical protein
MLENTKGATKNRQTRETGNIGYTRRRKAKQEHNTNNVNKTRTPLQTIGGKDEPNIVFMRIS